jgi:F0F1-type ATP synthase delta subunit
VEVRVKRELEEQLKEKLEAQLQKRKDEFERELAAEQMNAQAKIDASQRQLNQLRDQMAKKEEQHRRDMNNSTHESDSSRMELRRKLDKLDLSWQDKIEALNEA